MKTKLAAMILAADAVFPFQTTVGDKLFTEPPQYLSSTVTVAVEMSTGTIVKHGWLGCPHAPPGLRLPDTRAETAGNVGT